MLGILLKVVASTKQLDKDVQQRPQGQTAFTQPLGKRTSCCDHYIRRRRRNTLHFEISLDATAQHDARTKQNGQPKVAVLKL